MLNPLAHLNAFQEAIGNSAEISARDCADLNVDINALRRKTQDAMLGVTRPKRVDPGSAERYRQALLQGDTIVGRRVFNEVDERRSKLEERGL